MRPRSLPVLLLLLIFPLLGTAQAGNLREKDRAELEDRQAALQELAYTMHTDTSAAQRFAACKSLILGLVEALRTPNSFHYDFPGLEGLKVLEAPDGTFRIFSWELFLDRDDYRHYGAIQFNDKQLKLTPLVDRGDQLRENPENARLGPDRWLGYVAYKIVPGGTFRGQPYYFVFGYDRYGAFRRRKIVDVLAFDGFGQVSFGLPVFATYSDKDLLLPERKRLVLEYSARANVVLQHDPERNRIVYENLVLTPGEAGDDGPMYMPDGSYHALEYRETDGIWHEVDKVFDHTYEKAPRDVPLPAGKTDIIGRPTGGSGGQRGR